MAKPAIINGEVAVEFKHGFGTTKLHFVHTADSSDEALSSLTPANNTSSNYCALQAKLACAAARNASSASQVQFISSQKHDSEESVLLDRRAVSLKSLRGALKGMSVSDLREKRTGCKGRLGFQWSRGADLKDPSAVVYVK